MPLHLVDGPPGAGKTFFTVRKMVDILRNSGRRIVTNISVNPVRLAAVASVFDCERVDMDRVHEYLEYTDPDTGETGERFVFIGKEEIRQLWTLPELKGASVFLDELHTVFPKNDWSNVPQDLTDFLSEMRKGGIEFYVISQNIKNVVKQWRDLSHGTYYIRNSLTQSVSPGGWFGAIRWPLQFFMVRYSAAKAGKVSFHDIQSRNWYGPWGKNRLIFECYGSHVATTTKYPALQGSENLESDEHKDRGFLRNLGGEFLRRPLQFIALLLLAAFIGGLPFWMPWLTKSGVITGTVNKVMLGTSDPAKENETGKNPPAISGGGSVKSARNRGGVGVDRERDNRGKPKPLQDMGGRPRAPFSLIRDWLRGIAGLGPEVAIWRSGVKMQTGDTSRIGSGTWRLEEVNVGGSYVRWSWESDCSDCPESSAVVLESGTWRLRKSGKQPETSTGNLRRVKPDRPKPPGDKKPSLSGSSAGRSK